MHYFLPTLFFPPQITPPLPSTTPPGSTPMPMTTTYGAGPAADTLIFNAPVPGTAHPLEYVVREPPHMLVEDVDPNGAQAGGRRRGGGSIPPPRCWPPPYFPIWLQPTSRGEREIV